jgi:outer membrane scaffolding protein for murein synthesis (MipA/OmpV family)
MSELTASPTSVYIDSAISYPANVAKAISTYAGIHKSWATEYAALAAAENAVPVAAAEDARALSAAVAAGKDDPGGREVKAARAVVVSDERTRQAREKATAQTDVLKAAIAEAGPELVPIILAHIRSLADDYEAALEDARRKTTGAATALQDATSGVRMVTATLRDRYGLSVSSFSAVAQPTWPLQPCASIMIRLESIERTIAERA